MDIFIQSTLLPMCLGIIASTIAALLLIAWQFSSSTAGYRIKKVGEATEALTITHSHTSPLRDKYRYSLGIIIDDLHQSFKDGFNENGPWPALVDNGEECEPKEMTHCEEEMAKNKSKDRWDKFNKYIRPVIEDINTYSFIGLLQFTSSFRRLHTLTKLCHRLEDTIGELDAAFENKTVCTNGKENRIIVRGGKELEATNVRDAYAKLYKAWLEWENTVKSDVEFREAHRNDSS
ncbi:MAG: hypothetical protein ABI947_02150 [Chloroflexota bacterium]